MLTVCFEITVKRHNETDVKKLLAVENNRRRHLKVQIGSKEIYKIVNMPRRWWWNMEVSLKLNLLGTAIKSKLNLDGLIEFVFDAFYDATGTTLST